MNENTFVNLDGVEVTVTDEGGKMVPALVELLSAIADCLAKRPSPADTVPPTGRAALQAWK